MHDDIVGKIKHLVSNMVSVAGYGMAVPELVVDNQMMVDIFCQHGVNETPGGQPLTPGWINDIVGIEKRHYVGRDENTSDLAFAAAEMALKDAGISWEDLNIIRVGTSSPESFFPSTACLTGLKAAIVPHCEASDILAACTGGLQAIVEVQRALLCEPDYQFGLAIGAEVIAPRMLDFTDINSDLWGSGAGAVVLKKSGYFTKKHGLGGIICSILGAYPEKADTTHSVGKGSRYEDQMLTPNTFLVGREVQKFVISIIQELVPLTIAKANKVFAHFYEPTISIDDIDLFITHQANSRIYERPAKTLGIPVDKFYCNIANYGNTSTASIFIALYEAIHARRIKKGDLIMLIGFGGGLTYGSVLLRL